MKEDQFALQNDGKWGTIINWFEVIEKGDTPISRKTGIRLAVTRDGSMIVTNSRGSHNCAVGDWIVFTAKGEFVVVENSTFDPIRKAKDELG